MSKKSLKEYLKDEITIERGRIFNTFLWGMLAGSAFFVMISLSALLL